MGHYRTKLNFNWEAVAGAESALKRLEELYLALGDKIGEVSRDYKAKFTAFLENDLDTPRTVALLWELAKDERVSPADKKATILDFDKVLGLGIANWQEAEIPEEIRNLLAEREAARATKDFKKSDELRDKISALGYHVKDTEEGQKISKI